jgi:iron complex transport system permease protein
MISKTWLGAPLLLALTLLSFVASLSLGAAHTPFAEVIDALFASHSQTSVTNSIIWQLRMPRSILAFVAGGGLALAGLILQIVTRNPLADPYLFGISSGAMFGAVISISFLGAVAWLPLPVAAFIGSLFSMALLISFARINRFQQIETLLLAGVALSFLFSAFTSLFLYWSDPQAVTSILFWTLGSFSRAEWSSLWLPAMLVVLCLIVLNVYQSRLVALLLGDESAVTLGINVNKLRVIMLIISSILTAAIVALSGGIGFVGLMIPHLVRQFVHVGSRMSFVLTALVGGIFMLWVDVLARIILSNQELPIGVITAAIGSVFFLITLYSRASRQGQMSS